MSYPYNNDKYVVRLHQMGFTKVVVSRDSTPTGIHLTYRVKHPDIEGAAKFSAPAGDGHMERMLRAAKDALRLAYASKEPEPEPEVEAAADTVPTPQAEPETIELKPQRKAKVKK